MTEITEMTGEPVNDREVSAWWANVKDNSCWAGVIVNLAWDDLWDKAKDNLRVIYGSSAARMTEQRAREILAHMIQSNGNLYDEECLPVWRPGEPGALLMGRYTADELEAIAFWTRQHGN